MNSATGPLAPPDGRLLDHLVRKLTYSEGKLVANFVPTMPSRCGHDGQSLFQKKLYVSLHRIVFDLITSMIFEMYQSSTGGAAK
jgi:hypothetical protein